MTTKTTALSTAASITATSSSGSSGSSNNNNNSIIIVGLNAALQKRFILPQSTKLIPGNVHRATRIEEGIGGKGQDVAIALSCLVPKHEQLQQQQQSERQPQSTSPSSSSTKVYLAQFIGQGYEGDKVLQLLQNHVGIETATSLTVRTKSKLRTCTTIVAGDGVSTELIEPSGSITRVEVGELLAKVNSEVTTKDENFWFAPSRNNAGKKKNAGLIIMGSMPPGCPADMYARLYDCVAGAAAAAPPPPPASLTKPQEEEEEVYKEENDCHFITLIDSVVGLEPLLTMMKRKAKHDQLPLQGSIREKQKCNTMLKINAVELCHLVNMTNDMIYAGESTQGKDMISSNNINDEQVGAVSYHTLKQGIDRFLNQLKEEEEDDDDDDKNEDEEDKDDTDYPGKSLGYLAITDGKHPAYLVCIEHSITGTLADEDRSRQNYRKEEDSGGIDPYFDGGRSVTSRLSYRVYKLNVPDLSLHVDHADDEDEKKNKKKEKHLYPIGAGDTVAAGTLAAWLHLLHDDDHVSAGGDTSLLSKQREVNKGVEGQVLSQEVTEALRARFDEFLSSIRKFLTGREWEIDKHLVAQERDCGVVALAFAFGLACGSASCMEQENSVFNVKEAIRLFKRMDPPEPMFI